LLTELKTKVNKYCEDFSRFPHINSWDVSKVTNFATVFDGQTDFNEYIGGWDVSKATDVMGMFYLCSNFNQSLADWNVSQVTNMDVMVCRKSPVSNMYLMAKLPSTSILVDGMCRKLQA